MIALRLSSTLLVVTVAFAALAAEENVDPGEPPTPVLSALEREMAKLVAGLDYDEETAAGVARLLSSWQSDDGTPIVETWRTTLEKARAGRERAALRDSRLTRTELAVVAELGRTVSDRFQYKRRTGAFTLDRLLKKKTAQSVAYAQVVSVLAATLGLDVEQICVTYPIPGEQPTLSGHYACLIQIADGTMMLIDPTFEPVVSEAFDFATTYKKDGGFLVLADEKNPMGLHHRIRLLDHDGFRAAAFLGRAEAQYNATSWRKTFELADAALDLDPASAVAYRVRAVAGTLLARYDDAIADAEKALELDPDCAQVFNTIASVHWQKGDLDEALRLYARAIELDPGYAAPRMNRADLLVSQGKADEARPHADRAIEIAPNDPQIHLWKARHHERAGELEKAAESYTAALELDADYAVLHAYRANANARLGRRDEALADCAKAVELDPDSAALHVVVGSAFFRLEENDRAIEHFSKAIELDPGNPSPYCWRAHALQQRGDSWLTQARVINDLNKAIEVDPRCVGAYVARGDYFLQRDGLEKAFGDFNRAIELAPTYAGAYASRATAHLQQGDYEKAMADLDKAIELYPSYAYCYYKRGACRAELGQDEEAVHDLRKALELDPSFEEVVQDVASEHGLDLELDDDDDFGLE